ncbi:DegT/DnrJ/EryC1/StrS family aminotransferase [bacterium]|nr:DegT/DnrJ/EryC1/StrS family aminotransferase [bacterium]
MKRIEWWLPVLGAREKELVSEVIDRNFPNDGEYTTRFEQRIAEIVGAPHAVAVTSGTAALFLGLVACGVGAGDEVIVPDITFIATANAVSLAGAKPVFVDVDARTLCIDPAAIARAITPRTKAVVPVHVSGRGADMVEILALARARGLKVIEDAAEALGSRVGERGLGTFGEVGCFSFAANKTITTGQGGVVVTKDEATHRRLRELKDQGRPFRGTGGADVHVSLGYNFKLTNLQAAVGLGQLEGFAARREHQVWIYRRYKELLDGTPGIRFLGFDVENGACPQWVDIEVDGRDSLCDFLLERDIVARKFWFPIHTQAPYKEKDEKFPVATRVGLRSLWLPSALDLTEEDVRRVASAVREWSQKDARR